MVMTEDGMVVASELTADLDSESLAAITSGARLCIHRSAIQCGDGEPHRNCTSKEPMETWVLLEVGEATLIVVTHRGARN